MNNDSLPSPRQGAAISNVVDLAVYRSRRDSRRYVKAVLTDQTGDDSSLLRAAQALCDAARIALVATANCVL
jgi:hypothetical protein